MAVFVLIHGAWHGRWCWQKVIPLLEKAGHKVIAPDLPGHGENRSIPAEDVTIQHYLDCVIDVLDSQEEPVILVGHSMGGMLISQVAEHRPVGIDKLVYLCAFLLKYGEAMEPPDGAPFDPLTMSDSALREKFYGDCSDEDFHMAKSLLVPQPLAPVITPIHITSENYGRVSRIYITCLQDRAIDPAYQKVMYTATPCERVISMNTSHSPFLSQPEELASNLISVTRSR